MLRARVKNNHARNTGSRNFCGRGHNPFLSPHARHRVLLVDDEVEAPVDDDEAVVPDHREGLAGDRRVLEQRRPRLGIVVEGVLHRAIHTAVGIASRPDEVHDPVLSPVHDVRELDLMTQRAEDD